MKIVFIILLAFILLWMAWSYFVNDVETLSYEVVEKKENYEIRIYKPYIKAEVTVTGNSSRNNLYQAFNILATYIFGGNVSKSKISMTAPVLETQNISEKISMTAPVLEQKSGEAESRVSFTMPAKYKMEDLPTPNDERIKFVEVGEQKIAAYSLGYMPFFNRIEFYKQEFVKILQADSVEIISEPIFAGYNDPLVFPLFAKNEILVLVK